MASREELACVYAALILHDDNAEINAHSINQVLNAAKVKVPAYLPVLFARMIASRNIEDLILQGGAAAAPVPVAAGSAPAGAPAGGEKKEDDKKKKEEEEKKKKEEEEEEEMDMGGLFDFCLNYFCWICYHLFITIVLRIHLPFPIQPFPNFPSHVNLLK